MTVLCEAPAYLTSKDRVPLEVALEVIETELSAADFVDRDRLIEKGRQTGATAILWWLDHTLSVLLSHRHICRGRDENGNRGYRVTAGWERRDDVLKDLRPPEPRARASRRLARKLASQERRLARELADQERRLARQAASQERRRLMRATSSEA